MASEAVDNMDLKIRTDLALETKESLDEAGRLRGVVFDEKTDGETGIKISRLEVLNALAIDEPLEYVRLYLDGNMQMWVDAEDSLELW
jgi:hypothetical protein